ncbi:type I restriction enzyme HsdR N-terminal domain-containing protein, partial [bacterium]|nr:type I restriction enzyme HsdR N-terminal domain-containing protein [bacterium]
MNNVFDCIESLRTKLEKYRKTGLNEASTRRIFIEPMLEALGWPVDDPDQVAFEYMTIDGKYIDYALKIDDKVVLLVEAKSLNDPLDVKAIAQIIGYAANAGIEWCVLTNGLTYKVYRSTEKMQAPDKLFFEISFDPNDNKGMSDQQIREHLSRLSKDVVAKGILDQIGEDFFATGKIRKALDKIFQEPPIALVRLVRLVTNDDSIKPVQLKRLISLVWAEKTSIKVEEEHGDKLVFPPSDIELIDTIVVPAREEGFKEVFLGENRWWEIRIHASMIPRIKYIAAYQVAPISAVTHWAPVKNIVPWQDTGAFVVNFTQPPKEIEHINLVPKSRVKAPRGPR